MTAMQIWSASAFLLVTSLSCKTAPTEKSSEIRAVQGLPQIYPGRVEPGFTSIAFFETDANHRPVIGADGKEKVRHRVNLKFDASSVILASDAGKEYGPALVRNPDVTYSFRSDLPPSGDSDQNPPVTEQDKQELFSTESALVSNTLWRCGDAEKFVAKPLADESGQLLPEDDCYIEINTTGNNGINVSVVGAPEGRGLDIFINGRKPLLPSPELREPIDLREPAKLKPGQRINAIINHDFALTALKEMAAEFGQNDPQNYAARNTCLKNQRAIGWTDIQAHYYCQLPLGNVRTCFARRLIKTAMDVATGKFDLGQLEYGMCKVDDVAKVNPFCVAYFICLQNKPDFPFFDQDTEEGRRHQAQFAYLMFLKPGLMDFNIESENRVINEFYGVTQPYPRAPNFDGQKRPRRLLDTWPHWLPDQPRYNAIRQIQLDGLKKLKAASAAGGQ